MENESSAISEKKFTEKSGNALLLPLSILAGGLLIAVAVLYSNSRESKPSLSGNASIADFPSARTKNLGDDDPVLGDPDAPVTIVEFADFQCPFCKAFFETAEPGIIEKYVKTGKAKLIYRDFPLIFEHNMAQKSAEAAECADEQGKFWEYHDLLYRRQEELSAENLKKWAAEIGLNAAQFNSCLDSGKYFSEVRKDLLDGEAAGVMGTPATFINGRMIKGAVSFSLFQSVIEEELNKTQGRD